MKARQKNPKKPREDYAGGTMHFDGKLIRENGRFVPKALQALNPERLK